MAALSSMDGMQTWMYFRMVYDTLGPEYILKTDDDLYTRCGLHATMSDVSASPCLVCPCKRGHVVM